MRATEDCCGHLHATGLLADLFEGQCHGVGGGRQSLRGADRSPLSAFAAALGRAGVRRAARGAPPAPVSGAAAHRGQLQRRVAARGRGRLTGHGKHRRSTRSRPATGGRLRQKRSHRDLTPAVEAVLRRPGRRRGGSRWLNGSIDVAAAGRQTDPPRGRQDRRDQRDQGPAPGPPGAPPDHRALHLGHRALHLDHRARHRQWGLRRPPSHPAGGRPRCRRS